MARHDDRERVAASRGTRGACRTRRTRALRKLGIADRPAVGNARDLAPHATLELGPRRRDRQVEVVPFAFEVIGDLPRAASQWRTRGIFGPVACRARRMPAAFEI